MNQYDEKDEKIYLKIINSPMFKVSKVPTVDISKTYSFITSTM